MTNQEYMRQRSTEQLADVVFNIVTTSKDFAIYLMKVEGKAEDEISEDFGLDRNYVILNVSEYPSFDEMKTWVSFGENLYHLNEISSIVGALSSARFNSADISLYVPKEDLKKINRFKLDNYIDLPERVNKFDTIHFEQSTLF